MKTPRSTVRIVCSPRVRQFLADLLSRTPERKHLGQSYEHLRTSLLTHLSSPDADTITTDDTFLVSSTPF
jgi:hypothetical protein